MRILKLAAFFIPLFCAATLALASDFRSDEDAYAWGFRAGYNHGVVDRSARVAFNYRSSSLAINFDSYRDDNFRKGFEDGYSDGFYRGQRSTEVVYTNVYNPQSFQVGYREGYNHGLSDRQSGLDLDYRRNHTTTYGVSYESRSGTYDAGYVEGYRQAYSEAPVEVRYHPDTTVVSANPGLIIAFKHDDFRGEAREFPVGSYPKLHDGWNDSIDSVQILGNVRVILFEDANFKGKQLVVERSIKDLDDFNFDHKAGSMIIEPIN